MVVTPTHYNVESHYCHSMLELIASVKSLGIKQISFHLPTGDSLVTRARDRAARTFLESDADHMLSIDSDIRFHVADVRMLLDASETCDLVGSAYPLKRICWKAVHEAARAGVPPNELQAYAADYVLLAKRGDHKAEGDLMPVDGLGTGFLLTAREVFDRIRESEPENWYFDGMDGKPTHNYFEAARRDRNLLSEDWDFSRKAKLVGIQPMLHLGCKLSHIGAFEYAGDLMKQLVPKETAVE